MGREAAALAAARRNIDAWTRELDGNGLDAVVITASGCGTTIKDYGFMLRFDPDYAEKAARISALARDITEFLAELGAAAAGGPRPAGGRLSLRLLDAAWPEDHPRSRGSCLARAGFAVREPREGHLCCGSAGTYNILQPEIAARLRERKVENSLRPGPTWSPRAISAASPRSPKVRGMPIVHTVELLDWAFGGPRPAALSQSEPPATA